MKTCPFATASAIGLAALLAGCGDDGRKHYCDNWCEMALTVELEHLEDDGCELLDDEELLVGECEEICRTTAREMEDTGDVQACVDCLYDEVGGSPGWDEFQDALNGPCDDWCFSQSMIDFYDDFWGDWNYQEYDYECS
jgi:hypothetical protein